LYFITILYDYLGRYLPKIMFQDFHLELTQSCQKGA